MRKLMWFAIGFLAACTFCSYFLVPGLLLCAGLILVMALGMGLLSKKHAYLAVISLMLLGCALGFGWFWIYDSAYLSDARAMDGKFANASVTIRDYSEEADFSIVADGRVVINGKTYDVRVYLQDEIGLAPSDTVTGIFQFRFTALGGSREPISQRTEGTVLLLYQRSDVSVSQAAEVSWRDYPAVWRERLAQMLRKSLPADTSGFATALLLGDRSGIDYATNTAFKVSGISHIIAVSGLHVSILFGLIYTLTLRKRYLTGLIGIPALILFAAVVGFTPSVTRACVMQILMLLAMMTNKEYDPPTALAFSVLVMLSANPMTVASVSFQLSVGCMVGIFLFHGRISLWLQERKIFKHIKGRNLAAKCKRWFISSVSVTISAAVMTTPIVATYFGTISLVSILTNLLTLWVISFIFYGLMLVCGMSLLLPVAAAALGWIIGWPIRYVIGAAKLIGGFPLAAVYTKSIWIILWLAGCYGLLVWFLLSKRKRPVLFGCFATIGLCAAMLISWMIPLADSYRMTVLDVGQGQCILLQSEGKTFMVDCGGDSDSFAADQAAEYLLSQGVSKLDGIILTHYDADHAGGVQNLLTRIPADALYIPDISDGGNTKLHLMALDIPVELVSIDTKITFGGAEITIFASETTNTSNESGLSILFRKESCDILITGDKGALGEMLLMHHAQLPELDVLVAGHHGSAGSTGEDLLEKTTPETVIISAGKNNPYGHPSPALLERLDAWGCTVYRTDLMGTIVYRR